VEREFRAADPDRDSIVSRAEFKSRLGREAHSAPHNCLPASQTEKRRRKSDDKGGRASVMIAAIPMKIV